MRISDWSSDVCSSDLASVSTALADALIDTGNETAVARLVANEGAELTEAALGRVLSGYTGSEVVAESIARRPSLPPAISEHLVSAMAKKLQGYLVSKHDLPADARSEEHTSELQSLMRTSY